MLLRHLDEFVKYLSKCVGHCVLTAVTLTQGVNLSREGRQKLNTTVQVERSCVYIDCRQFPRVAVST